MTKYSIFRYVAIISMCISCSGEQRPTLKPLGKMRRLTTEMVITDCNYTFEQSVVGSNAPESILGELQLLNVRYYSLDGKIHAGQILTNKKIATKIDSIFKYILKVKFPVAHAIPIVKYNWNDDLSMSNNNTYSFCYRNSDFSKHAIGMAIDINPYFNPLRWKDSYSNRKNKPLGAKYDTIAPGTFYGTHAVVKEFIKKGFRWGHNFTQKYDDHHFEIKYL